MKLAWNSLGMRVIFDFYYTKLLHHLSSILVNDNYWLWPWHDESCKLQVAVAATAAAAAMWKVLQLPSVAEAENQQHHCFGLSGGEEEKRTRQRQILLVLLTSLVELVLFIWVRTCNVMLQQQLLVACLKFPNTHPHTHTHPRSHTQCITCNNPLTPKHAATRTHMVEKHIERDLLSQARRGRGRDMQMHLGVKRR